MRGRVATGSPAVGNPVLGSATGVGVCQDTGTAAPVPRQRNPRREHRSGRCRANPHVPLVIGDTRGVPNKVLPDEGDTTMGMGLGVTEKGPMIRSAETRSRVDGWIREE